MHVFATDRTYTGQHKVNSGIYDVGDYARNYGDSDQPLFAPEPVEQEPVVADIFTSKRRLSVIDYISNYFWKPIITTSAPTRNAAMITSEAPKSETIYYCWLYDWNTRTIDVLTRARPAFALCEVRHDELFIVSPSARLSIALANIHEVRLWRWASAGAKITINVEIRFLQPESAPDQHKHDAVVYLVPMDVYTYDTSLRESEDLVRAINIFKSGGTPDIEINPYLRRKKPKWSISRKSTVMEFDPTTPPHIYTEPTYSIRVCLLTFIVIVVTTIVILPILGIILNALIGTH